MRSILIIAATVCFCAGCSVMPTVRGFNGSFALGLEGWKIQPPERASIVGEDRILNIALSPSEKVQIVKITPLNPETEVVKISFRIRYQRGSTPRNNSGRPSYSFSLQEPVTYGNYNSGKYLVNPYGNWETHEIVQMYTSRHPGHNFLRLRPLPKELVFNITLDEGDGSFQFDDFRAQEFVAKATIEHW